MREPQHRPSQNRRARRKFPAIPNILFACIVAGMGIDAHADTGILETPKAGTVVLLGEPWLSGGRADYNLSIAKDGKRLVFARSDANFAHAQIWQAHFASGKWSAPAPIAFSDPRYRDSDPWLTPDGESLYFVSDRPFDGSDAPRRDFDIWRVRRNRSGSAEWGKPEHLAGEVNSTGLELGPELHGDWLYFNSTRAGGPAKMSLYRAHREGDGFAAPQALPAPFNDGVAQGDLTFSPDGKIAVWWSKRGDGAGDLYAARRHGDGWEPALRLPAPFNLPGFNFTPEFSADGEMLYFASTRKDGETHGILNGLANLYSLRLADVAPLLDRAGANAQE